MQKLTVIGNNVANVNTQGYKKQRTVFRDSVYSMYSSGSNGSEIVGGMNPSQLGYGSMIGSIDLNMSSSSYNPGNPTDCALVGDGFFLVGTKDAQYGVNPDDYSTFTSENLKSLNLTRVGDFEFKADNYLTDAKGNVVYGFMTTNEMEEYVDVDGKTKTRHKVSDQLVPIRLPRWDENHVIKYARTDIDPATDAPAGAGTGTTPPAGGAADTQAAYRLVDDKPKYNAGGDGTGGATNPDDTANLPAEYEFAQLDSISIDAKTGCIKGISKEDGQPVIIGYLAVASVTNPNGVSHIGKSYYRCGDGAGALNISMLGSVHKDLGITHVNGSRAPVGDGTGTNPPAGGDNTTTPDYVPGTDVVGTSTEMLVGFLEAPNVDLAEEIAELITTQRGYQANTRIITVTDSMLEELVNMKR